MSIAAKCECGKTYKLGDDAAGKKFKCKACQAVVRVPVPKTAPPDDEFDDFGDLGDDFGDDFGEDYPAAPVPPKKKSGGKAKGKSKSGGKKKPAKKKGAKKKGSSEMSPAMKYGLAGGIVVVTIGLIVGILYANGTIGGGQKDTSNNTASTDDDGAQGMGMDPAGVGPGGDPNGNGNGNGNGNSGNANGNGKQPNKKPSGFNWIAHNDQQGRFQVSFPGPIKRETHQEQSAAGPLPVNTIKVEWSPDTGVGVIYTDYPNSVDLSTLDAKRRILNGAINIMTKVVKGRNSKRQYLKLSQHEGIEAKINTSGSGKAVVQMFLVDHRLYTVLAMWDGTSSSQAAAVEKFVASFKVGGQSATPAGKKPTGGNQPQPLAAAEFLKKYPSGNIKMQGKRVQVRGKIEKVAGQGWVFLTGDGTRNIACRIDPPPSNFPQFGQEIALEGEFGNNNAMHISMIKCKLLALPKKKPKQPGNSGGSSMTQQQMTAKKPDFLLKGEAVEVAFAKNKQSIRKYDGKIIEVEGNVIRFFPAGQFGRKHGGLRVGLPYPDGIMEHLEITTESRFQPEPWARVSRQQIIRVKGLCKMKAEFGTLSLALSDCVYTPVRTNPTVVLSGNDFHTLAMTGTDAVRKKYGFKEFALTGLRFQSTRVDANGAAIVLRAPRGGLFTCRADKLGFETANNVKQGQSVSVYGKFDKFDPTSKSVVLTECWLITGKLDLSSPKGKTPDESSPPDGPMPRGPSPKRPPTDIRPPMGGKKTGNANTKKYTNTAGRYAVAFPGKPMQKSRTVGKKENRPLTHGAIVEPSSRQRFSVTYYDLPQKTPAQTKERETYLRGKLADARNLIVAEYKGTKPKSTFITQGRYHGLDARFSNQQQQQIRMRAFLADRRVYQVVAIWTAGNAQHKAAADRFVKSFEIGTQKKTP